MYSAVCRCCRVAVFEAEHSHTKCPRCPVTDYVTTPSQQPSGHSIHQPLADVSLPLPPTPRHKQSHQAVPKNHRPQNGIPNNINPRPNPNPNHPPALAPPRRPPPQPRPHHGAGGRPPPAAHALGRHLGTNSSAAAAGPGWRRQEARPAGRRDDQGALGGEPVWYISGFPLPLLVWGEFVD